MGWFTPSKPKNVRSRDGQVRQTSSERRRFRKITGFSSRQQKIMTKARRRRRKGW